MSERDSYVRNLWESVDKDRDVLPKVNDLAEGIFCIQRCMDSLQFHHTHVDTTRDDIMECMHDVIVTCLRVAEDLGLTVTAE